MTGEEEREKVLHCNDHVRTPPASWMKQEETKVNECGILCEYPENIAAIEFHLLKRNFQFLQSAQ